MTERPRHIDHLDAALDGDEGLRAVWALRRLAERALMHGDEAERVQAARLLDYLDTGAGGGLDAALGLAGPGWSGALTRYRQERRNEALRGIRRDAYADVSTANAARLIAAGWRLVKARWDKGAEAPLACPNAALWRLLEAGHGPLEAETVRRILAGDVGHLRTLEPPSPPDDV